MDEIVRIIWEKVSPEIIEMLKTGEAKQHNGVVYNANGGILAHLPIDKIDLTTLVAGGPVGVAMEGVKIASSLAQAMQLADVQKKMASMLFFQKANIAVTVCSTAALMGALFIATRFLSEKLDKINEKLCDLEKIANEIKRITKSTNDRIDAIMLSEYLGAIRNIHTYLNRESISEKDMPIFHNMLANLSEKRSKLIELSKQYFNLMLQETQNHGKSEVVSGYFVFLKRFMELLPYGSYAEYSSYCKQGDYRTADDYAKDSYEFYTTMKENISLFISDQNKAVLHGIDSPFKTVLYERKQEQLEIRKTTELDFIMALPQGMPVQQEVLKKMEIQSK